MKPAAREANAKRRCQINYATWWCLTHDQPLSEDGVCKRKVHPWKRIGHPWAFRAWARRNPGERKRVNERFAAQNEALT